MFGLPGGMEWVVILVVLLLLFGRRMPEVARSFGKSIVEFKRGMKDVREEINEATTVRGYKVTIQRLLEAEIKDEQIHCQQINNFFRGKQ